MTEQRVSPTPLAAAVFLAGSVTAILPAAVDERLWAVWFAFVFGFLLLLGADWVFGPRLGRLGVSITTPPRLFVAADHTCELTLDNPAPRGLNLRLRVDVSDDLEEIEDRRVAAGPAGETRARFPLRARRRGTVAVESVWCQARGPFGLMRFARCDRVDRELAVDPDLPGVSRGVIRYFSSRSHHQGVQIERHLGTGTEFEQLREYVPGFDIRTVDWKASARHAKMLCREYRAERNRQILLAVDSGRLMMEPLGGLSRLDHAIHAALALAYVSLRVGDRVGLFSFDDRLRHYCPPVKGRAAMGVLNETAARIEYTDRDTNFTLSMIELAQRQVRRALVVVLTDFVDGTSAELMIENLARVARRNLVLFVALQDPLLIELADRRPLSPLDLYESVVAQQLARDRRAVLQRLQRCGVHCVSALPTEVSGDLISRYLELKRRESF